MRRILLALAVASLLAVMAASPAAAAQPVGGCPTGYELVSVKYIVKNAPLEEPDPSMDAVNGDGYTCLMLLQTGSGTRATWHDNTLAPV
jgi:hypothetical protein